MVCEDILNIKELNGGLHLVAGEKGLSRVVRWIYFADCMECIDDNLNPAEWIHGGELIVVTNESFTSNEDKLLTLMKATNEKNVAGFIINIGQILPAAIELSNELCLPLFEISWDLKLIDLSQTLCLALVNEANYNNSLNHLLFSILYADNMSGQDIIYQAEHFGVNLHIRHQVIIFDIDHFSRYIKENKILNEDAINLTKEMLLKIIKREFRMNGLRNLMTLMQGDCIISLIPSDQFGPEELQKILENIQQNFLVQAHMTLTIGVGNSYYYIEEWKQSYQEAKEVIDLFHYSGNENKIVYYKDFGVYSLLSHVEDDKILEAYYKALLGPLIEADHYSDSSFCETLEAYFQNNCNANATAESLYIHRNTMRYRLDKIKVLLDKDINNINVCMELNLAFHIKKYLESHKQ